MVQGPPGGLSVHFPPVESGRFLRARRRGSFRASRSIITGSPFLHATYNPSVRACRPCQLPLHRGAKGAGMCLPAGLARQNRQKLTKRGALCYDGDRRCQIRQAVSTSRKGGDAHGYIRRADPDRYFDREHLQSGLSDLQKEMTAPGQGVRSNPLIQT